MTLDWSIDWLIDLDTFLMIFFPIFLCRKELWVEVFLWRNFQRRLILPKVEKKIEEE